MSQFIGRRIVPLPYGEWDINKSYEELLIVRDSSTGDSYISRKPVPAGTAITDTAYWMLYSAYSVQIDNAVKQMEQTASNLTAHVDKAEASMENRVKGAETLTDSNKDTLNSRMDTIEKRLDANVKASTDGSADYAAEVVDARVSADGKTYDSMGTHLRTIESGCGLPPSFSANVSYHCTSDMPLVLIEFEEGTPVFKLNEKHTASMLLFYNRGFLYPFFRSEMSLSQETEGQSDYNYLFLDVKDKVLHVVKPGVFTAEQAVYPDAVYVGFVRLFKGSDGLPHVENSFSKTIIPVGTVDSYGNYTLVDRVENELSSIRKGYVDNHSLFANGIWKAVLMGNTSDWERNRPFLCIRKKYSKEMLDRSAFKERIYFEVNPTCVADKDRLLVFYNNTWQFWDTADSKIQLLSWDEESESFVEVNYFEKLDYWYINCQNNVFQIVQGSQYYKYCQTHRNWWSCGYYHYTQPNTVLPVEYIDLRSYYPRIQESIPYHDDRNHMMGYLYSTNSNMTFNIDTFELSGATHVITPAGIYSLDGVRYVKYDETRSDNNKYLYLVFYPASRVLEWVSAGDFTLSGQQFNAILVGMVYAGTPYANFNSANVKLKGTPVPKVTVIGDSISTFEGYLSYSAYSVYYRKGGPITVGQSWWMKLVSNLDAELFSNMSSSGSRVTTTLDTVSQPSGVTRSRIVQDANGKSPDIVIIYLGTNDWSANVPVGTYDGKGAVPTDGKTFREAYAMMLNNITSGSPNAKIFCCTLLDRERGDSDKTAPEVNSGGTYLSEYNDAIREIADVFNAEVIDLHTCGINHHNMSSYMADYNGSTGSGLHPNAAGHDLMYRKIRQSVEPFVEAFNRNKLPWSQTAEPKANSGMENMTLTEFVYEE